MSVMGGAARAAHVAVDDDPIPSSDVAVDVEAATPEPLPGVEVEAPREQPSTSHAYLSIGQVMAELKDDFPDLSISKVRFLEAEGLITPQRTESNYRKFSKEDVERLRYVLRAQRDHYLPLKVIRAHLESMDRGFEPPPVVGEPRVPERVDDGEPTPTVQMSQAPRQDVRLSRPEMLRESGLTDTQLRELETFGLVESRNGHYDTDSLETATTVAQLMKHGNITGRHLARFRNAADREVDLSAQVVTPLMRQRDPEARARAEETASELATLFIRLHAGLVRSGMRRMMDGG